LDEPEARERVARVESLLEAVDTLPDRVAREAATELVQALLDLYGEGLRRILAQATEMDGRTAAALADDELVAHLLLLHGLHPVPLETRVRQGLDEVRPYLESHGGDVELLGVEDGVARLRLEGTCSGCPSSTMTLKLAVERAVQKAAPEVERIEADGAPAPAAPTASPLIQLEVTPAGPGDAGGPPEPEPSWVMAGGLPELNGGGGPVPKQVSGEPLLFLEVEGTSYAYRPRCPGCEASLDDATLDEGGLQCAGCGRRYDVRRAGRCLDDPELHLDPVPLLVDETGLMKVALGPVAA
jgi:Fe-S cluster biogenesis protein NfuA/nitrite reductase/ring-hydroxylating ferredoxin subunit